MQDIQLFDIETLKSPHAAYKRLRDEAPVYFAKELGLHVVSRYDLLREALRDPKTYSSEVGNFLQRPQEMRFQGASPETQERIEHLRKQLVPGPPRMLTLDRPEHTA